MTPPTVYLARRVGNRILCARPVPSRGFCSGLVGTVAGSPWAAVAVPRSGLVEAGRDDRGVMVLRETARAKRKRDDHDTRKTRQRYGVPRPDQWRPSRTVPGAYIGPAHYGSELRQGEAPDLPWQAPCGVCNVLALVTDAVLKSMATEDAG